MIRDRLPRIITRSGIGNPHIAVIADKKDVQDQAQDTEDDNVDHVDLGMARGDDERIAHQVRYILKDEKKEEDVQDPDYAGGDSTPPESGGVSQGIVNPIRTASSREMTVAYLMYEVSFRRMTGLPSRQ